MKVLPEILIVGDDRRRSDLAERVRAHGYVAAQCASNEVVDRVAQGPVPAAIIVCSTSGPAGELMAALRQAPHGAAIPVSFYGRFGGEIRDLADVLDLGADHFFEDPVSDEQLGAGLEALAGPAPTRPVDARSAPEPDLDDELIEDDEDVVWPSRTEVIDEPEPTRTSTGSGRVDGDPVLGQLQRTLGMVDQRMRARDPFPGDSSDDLDLSALGFDGLPDVEGEGGVLDPAESHLHLEVAQVTGTGTGGRPSTDPWLPRPTTPRESTVLLGEGTPRSLRVGRGPGPFGRTEPVPPPRNAVIDEDRSSARMVHDRPRRSPPLPVEREGSLSTIEVPRLLWKLYRGRFTGRLLLTRGRVEKAMWFERGNVVFARSNVGHDRLIDGLLRRGLLTRAQYDTARRLAAKEPRRAGQLLVEAGFLKSGELPRVIREHLMRIIDSTFPWNEGGWKLDPEARCDESVLLDKSLPAVLVDGIRNRMEAPQLWALLGGPRQFPRRRPEIEGREEELRAQLGLQPAEERLIARFDGKHSLEQLARDPRHDELELLTFVYALHVLELCDVIGEREPEPRSERDPAAVDRARILERVALARESDYFSLLGLDLDATRVDVRRAYAELSDTFDDRNLEPSVIDALTAELAELRAALRDARRILADDALRNAYLAHLEEP